MSQHRVVGRYYQFVGRIREWLGVKGGSAVQVEVGRRDQLIGRIAEHCRISLTEAEKLADELPSCREFTANGLVNSLD